MNKFFRITGALLFLIVFTVGCEQASSPVALSANEDIGVSPEEAQAQIDRIQAELKRILDETINDLVPPEFKYSSKGGVAQTDQSFYWNGYVNPYRGWSQGFDFMGFLTISTVTFDWFTALGGSPEVDYVVIPMTRETFDNLQYPRAVYIINGGYNWNYNPEYVENDGRTGISGFKVSSPAYNNLTSMFFQSQMIWYSLLDLYEYEYAVVDHDGSVTYLPAFLPYYEAEEEEETYTLSGSVFFDINGNGSQDGDEPGIAGTDVSITGGASTSTDSDGNYSFSELDAGDYTVSVDGISGFSSTTGLSYDVELTADEEADFGFELNFDELSGTSDDSNGGGWWKGNIAKAVRGQARGAQISAGDLETLRASLEDFALAPLNFASLANAHEALGYGGRSAADRLAKHLTAAEYNYANGAFLNGDALVTWAFMVWGEYMVGNAGDFNNGALNDAKDLFEGYNSGEIE